MVVQPWCTCVTLQVPQFVSYDDADMLYNRCNCLHCRYPSLWAMMTQTWCTNWWTYRVWRCTATPTSPCWQIFLCRHWLWGLVFLCHHYNGYCLCCTVCLSVCLLFLSVFALCLHLSVGLSTSLSVSVCLSLFLFFFCAFCFLFNNKNVLHHTFVQDSFFLPFPSFFPVFSFCSLFFFFFFSHPDLTTLADWAWNTCLLPYLLFFFLL